jgi:hypothetical protein
MNRSKSFMEGYEVETPNQVYSSLYYSPGEFDPGLSAEDYLSDPLLAPPASVPRNFNLFVSHPRSRLQQPSLRKDVTWKPPRLMRSTEPSPREVRTHRPHPDPKLRSCIPTLRRLPPAGPRRNLAQRSFRLRRCIQEAVGYRCCRLRRGSRLCKRRRQQRRQPQRLAGRSPFGHIAVVGGAGVRCLPQVRGPSRPPSFYGRVFLSPSTPAPATPTPPVTHPFLHTNPFPNPCARPPHIPPLARMMPLHTWRQGRVGDSDGDRAGPGSASGGPDAAAIGLGR